MSRIIMLLGERTSRESNQANSLGRCGVSAGVGDLVRSSAAGASTRHQVPSGVDGIARRRRSASVLRLMRRRLTRSSFSVYFQAELQLVIRSENCATQLASQPRRLAASLIMKRQNWRRPFPETSTAAIRLSPRSSRAQYSSGRPCHHAVGVRRASANLWWRRRVELRRRPPVAPEAPAPTLLRGSFTLMRHNPACPSPAAGQLVVARAASALGR